MNGKSGNMNNVLQQIYPTGCFIPPDELIAVFDADQVRRRQHSLRKILKAAFSSFCRHLREVFPLKLQALMATYWLTH